MVLAELGFLRMRLGTGSLHTTKKALCGRCVGIAVAAERSKCIALLSLLRLQGGELVSQRVFDVVLRLLQALQLLPQVVCIGPRITVILMRPLRTSQGSVLVLKRRNSLSLLAQEPCKLVYAILQGLDCSIVTVLEAVRLIAQSLPVAVNWLTSVAEEGDGSVTASWSKVRACGCYLIRLGFDLHCLAASSADCRRQCVHLSVAAKEMRE